MHTYIHTIVKVIINDSKIDIKKKKIIAKLIN